MNGNLTKYYGPVINGKACGKGTATYPHHPDMGYDGDFIDNKRNGRGVMTWANGDTYDGVWKDDKTNGRGVMTWVSGSKYDGVWKKITRRMVEELIHM
jgi:hypothetical protein